jgi:pimeloyl-ACP methyl ester carboxylesterase
VQAAAAPSPLASPPPAPAAAASVQTAPAASTPASPAPPSDAYATVHGLKMHYLRQGSGPALVLLHGGITSATFCWSKAFPFFSSSFDVIAPDQMGHGGTGDDPKRAFDYHAMAEDTADLLSQLGVTQAMFVGWSDGADIALDLAMHHPALVKKVVTSGANMAPDGLVPFALKLLRDPKKNVADMDMFAPIKQDYAKQSPDGVAHWPLLVERVRKMWVTQPGWTPKDLKGITAPTLVMAGDQDLIRLEHTGAIANAIPGAQLAVLPNEDHGPMIDHAPWNAMVLAFLNAPPPQAPSKYRSSRRDTRSGCSIRSRRSS